MTKSTTYAGVRRAVRLVGDRSKKSKNVISGYETPPQHVELPELAPPATGTATAARDNKLVRLESERNVSSGRTPGIGRPYISHCRIFVFCLLKEAPCSCFDPRNANRVVVTDCLLLLCTLSLYTQQTAGSQYLGTWTLTLARCGAWLPRWASPPTDITIQVTWRTPP